MTTIAYVGSRTTQARKARGKGLSVFRIEGTRWQQLQMLEMENPSFLAFDHARQNLYTVHGDLDRVSAFRIDPATGCLAALNQQVTMGRNPVHLSFDPADRFLVVANHVTSSLAVLPRERDGRLGPIENLTQITGEIGPHRVEQPFPKPHQVEFDPSGHWIVVPDKGIDKLLVYRLEGGQLVQVSACPCREGAGPRHVAFHPDGRRVYVVNELDSTVAACRFDPQNGAIAPFQILSALPEDFTGNSRGAEIAVSDDGQWLHASNRGSDSIASFPIRPDGRLGAPCHRKTGGRTPRFFALFGDRLFAANEDDDNITMMPAVPGELPEGQVEVVARVGSPVCILFHEITDA
ncbi:beta-propeller fold lactonase family protein [Paracoccus sp. DMF-8]|uniref:lactonase family protein n=1 Tax=Paracoccus sp. DMF-8 TaxID=3019445 RepID=UPI0023E7EC7A|nr:beta-propeller fold lactonase family protein [Paracoccus sp. DMF-8]MDF3606694.1 beta-propeller fold lactonase family protein [Paracoccus sp. DMF-8]